MSGNLLSGIISTLIEEVLAATWRGPDRGSLWQLRGPVACPGTENCGDPIHVSAHQGPFVGRKNYRQCGFVDAQAMVEAFMTGEDAQLLGMARFLVSTGLNEKLSKHDWAGFARGYNGPSYKSTRYDVRLAEAYEKGSAVHLTLDPSKDWGIDTRNTAIASMHLKKAMTRQTSAGVAATTAVAGGAGLYHYHALVWADWLFGALIAGGLLAAFIAAVMSKERTNMAKTAMLGAK